MCNMCALPSLSRSLALSLPRSLALSFSSSSSFESQRDLGADWEGCVWTRRGGLDISAGWGAWLNGTLENRKGAAALLSSNL